MTGGTYSASPARADGYLNIRGITPKKGPMEGGKGGISWIEITSAVNNPQLSPLAAEFLAYVQDPKVAHTVAFAEGTFNPVAQMGNPECFKPLHPEELDAIQWDSLEEEMAGSVEYDIVPDYDKLLDIMTAAKREASRRLIVCRLPIDIHERRGRSVRDRRRHGALLRIDSTRT